MRVPVATVVGLALSATVAWGCTEAQDDPRLATVVNTIVAADMPFLRARPQLAVGKYQRMAYWLYDFYRGTFPLYLHDARHGAMPVSSSAFWVPGALVTGMGDVHLENFGLVRGGDGVDAVEPNDFDAADRYPYLWEVRRLAAAMVVAARVSNPDDPDARQLAAAASEDMARAVATGYATRLDELAAGATPERISDPGTSLHFADLFDRGQGDWDDLEELEELTELQDGARRLRRGILEDDEPHKAFGELPAFVHEALPGLLSRYRGTLVNPPPPEYFALLDAVRRFGKGTASWPRVRLIVLVQGPTDGVEDDVLLEVKELMDSGAGGWAPPGVFYDSVPERIIGTSRQLWAVPDAEPLWSADQLRGFSVQLRREAEGHKGLKWDRLEDELGTPEALVDLATRLGRLLARMHAASDETVVRAIAEVIATDPDGFAAEQAAAGVAYADQAVADWQLFQRALDELGPLLGVVPDLADAACPDLQALYGQPPVPAPEPP